MLRLEKTLKAGQRKFPPHQVDYDDDGERDGDDDGGDGGVGRLFNQSC